MTGSFLQYTTSSFVYCVIAAENLCLINAMLPELLMSCQFTVISFYFQVYIENNWALGHWGANVCAWWRCWWLGKPTTHCLLQTTALLTVTTSTAPRCYIQRSFYILYGPGKKKTVQQRVRSRLVTFIVFVLTFAHFTSSSNHSSLHGTCPVLCFFFYCKDEIHVNTKIMKGIRNVQLILAALTIPL